MNGLMLARRGAIARPAALAALPLVTRDPATGNLMLSGTQFRWGGSGYGPGGLSEDTLDSTTYPALTPTYTDSVTFTTGSPPGPAAVHLPNHAETDAQVAALMALGTRVTRSFGLISIGSTLAVMPSLSGYDPVTEVGSLTLNPNTLESVDYALTRLAANNIRVIFPLVDNYDYFDHGKYTWCNLCGVTPDGAATQFFSTTKIKNAFKKYVSAILNHVNIYTGVAYKADSTILAWETGNELDNGTVSDSNLTTWTDEISTHIKVTEAAQQLVADGVYGLTGDWSTYADARLALTNVDLYSTHSYDSSRTPANILLEARKAKDAKKAFFLGEYPANGGGMAVTVDVLHQEMADSLEVDGTNFWSLHGVGVTHPGAFQLHAGDGNASKFSTHAALIKARLATGLLTDNFTGTNGTALTAHTADSGATWAVQAGSTPGGKIQSNRLYFDAASYLYSSDRPPSPDYEVTGNVNLVSAVASSQTGVSGRMLETAQTMYYAFVYYAGGWFAYLYRFLGGGGTELANVAISPAPTVGTDHALTLRMAGDQISVLWDGATVISPITDPYIKAAGKAGVNGTAVTPTTGVHINNVSVAQIIGSWTPSGSTKLPGIIDSGDCGSSLVSGGILFEGSAGSLTPDGARNAVALHPTPAPSLPYRASAKRASGIQVYNSLGAAAYFDAAGTNGVLGMMSLNGAFQPSTQIITKVGSTFTTRYSSNATPEVTGTNDVIEIRISGSIGNYTYSLYLNGAPVVGASWNDSSGIITPGLYWGAAFQSIALSGSQVKGDGIVNIRATTG